MPLIGISKINNFDRVRSVRPSEVREDAIKSVQELHEIEEMEAWIKAILHDTNDTPHGPAEIVDIWTHKIVINGKECNSAFILKGKSFPTVRPAHVGHQIFRLERVRDLSVAVLAASGTVLDEVKEQFISTAQRLGSDYAIFDAHDLARLFIAYGYLCPRDGNKINGGRCHCGYTPPTRTSNILQQEALRELKRSHELEHKAGAVVLPTGAGKTSVATRDVKSRNPRLCLYVAHSHEILEDAETEFLRHFTSNEVRRFEARPRVDQLTKINLITIQLLSRNMDVFARLNIDYMIVDEFHHAAAKSYRRTLETLSPKFLLGLTATPFRGDQQDVIKLCDDNIVISYDLREGIELGILCPYHYYGCFDDIDYSNISHNGSRYDINDLEKSLIIPERDIAIINKWQQLSPNKPTIAFCCSHAHALRVKESFERFGVKAESYLSSTPGSERKQIRTRFEAGDTKIICAVNVLNEGIDIPFAECLLFLRPTESRRIFFQQLGRGLRHYVGKEKCIVIDFIVNFKNAYKVVEYQGLEPPEADTFVEDNKFGRSVKDLLNLPRDCAVEFEDRVINIFGEQTLNPRYATRHNIGRILIYEYHRLEKAIGRPPTTKDVDRNNLLGKWFYERVFGSWENFQAKLRDK